MLTVKCPHCNTALQLRQAPASGKVKCPKCSNVVPVQPAARPVQPAARPVPAGQSGQALDPDDEGFDFGRINFPSASPVVAVSQFPVGGRQLSAYEGPIPGDPLDALAAESADGQLQSDEATARPSKKTSPMVVVGALAGVGVLVIGAIVAVVMFGGSGDKGSGGDKVDVLAAMKATAPSGYQAVGFQGCAILVPKGEPEPGVDKLSTGMERVGIRSSASGSFFFFGVMPGSTQELTDRQITKNAERQLRAGILGSTPVERNGYKGIKSKLDQSLFVPNMMIEIYVVDGRFVILGCAPASFEASTETQMTVDRKLEQAEQDVFYKSFKIGPKPSGWLF